MGEKPCGDVQELARQGMPDGDRYAQTHRRGQEGATPAAQVSAAIALLDPAQAIALGISRKSLEEIRRPGSFPQTECS
jgi:hypothetical protein